MWKPFVEFAKSPRHASGWENPAVQSMIQELNMCLVDFDGCRVGLVDENFRSFLEDGEL